jgi:DNA helicase HerA-like ATPase
VLGQLGNRVQHALRAFTPRDQKAVKAAAETMRANPKLKVESVITELGVGEALVSFLDEKGRPCVVERALILPPASRIGPIADAERQAVIRNSVIFGHYEQAVDRESAYEKLKERALVRQGEPASGGTRETAGGRTGGGGFMDALGDMLGGTAGPRGGRREGALESAAKSAARAIGSQVGREIVRGVLGSIFGGARRR